MKTLFKLFLILAVAAGSLSVQGQSRKGVSILGDSYSTFKGYMTSDKNKVWYSTVANPERTDVDKVSQTWWHKLIKDQGYRLVTNNSYSGATICNTGYSNNDYKDRSFVSRLGNLGSPDIIYVFGGTNDDWAKSPMGEFKYDNWTDTDLYQVRPAIAYMISGLQDHYPGAEIVMIINSGLRPDVVDAITSISKHYGVDYIELQDIDKRSNHPTVKGMQQIAEQIANHENRKKK
ncbi:MAG: SGNH/GDSL hydrolase family protein [Firmicutes bacterium]|nr:SGNH/GDSL hydrolase family protein [Bacillota bacterium]MCM1400481.1 SGNH/GDSL hydrolase family protein [Bacteroides sp.]MCM1477452.1 SGNH/GDSL hydrolase family protein [Bacteroides sp.]